MANRRMFSKSITNSARFLKMPMDSQNLYFHLGMSADDDGIVEAYSIMKCVGSNEDNLRVLASKGFVKILNEDLVSFITDWNEHNLIRADRKVDSIYKYLLLKMVPEIELKEPKPRKDTGKLTGQPMDVQSPSMDGIVEGSVVECSKVYDSKVEGKESKRTHFIKPTNQQVFEYLSSIGLTDKEQADKFIDYHESRGWVVGKAPMKSWEAACRTWKSNYRSYGKPLRPVYDDEARTRELESWLGVDK